MDQFVLDLQSKNMITPIIFKENHIEGLTRIFKALLLIIPGIYFLYKFFYKNERVKFFNINDIEKKENEKNKSNNILNVINGLILLFLGIRIWFFYKPDNSQLSLAILIKYLKNKKIINNEFYDILKNFKPENIEYYV